MPTDRPADAHPSPWRTPGRMESVLAGTQGAGLTPALGAAVSVPLSAALALAALLAGCATPAELPPNPPPLSAATLALDATPLAATASDWWTAWHDLALDAVVVRALAASPTLAIAQARLVRAEAARESTAARSQPQVGLDLELTRQRYTENGLVPPPLAGSIDNSGTLQASARWTLDFFGRQRAALDAALGSERAAAADRDAARVVLASETVRAYVALARWVEQREIARRAVAQREETLALVEQRVAGGLDTNVELRQAQAALPDARQQVAALDEQIALARHALALLSGQRPDALDALEPRLSTQVPATLPAAGLPAALLGRRADVEAARQRAEAARGALAEARAAFYPNVDLIAFAGLSTLGLDRLLSLGSRQYGFGPAVTLPIFDGGALRAAHKARNADLDAAIDSYNETLLVALREVADQVSAAQSIERQQREQAAAQAASESAYELARQRYRAGIGSYLTVLAAESAVLQQRRLGVDLRARVLDNQAALARALGGGYQAEPQPVVAGGPPTPTTEPTSAGKLR